MYKIIYKLLFFLNIAILIKGDQTFLGDLMTSLKQTLTQLSVIGLFLTLTACSGQLDNTLNQNEQGQANLQVHPFDVNQHKLNKVVCDPMGSGGDSYR